MNDQQTTSPLAGQSASAKPDPIQIGVWMPLPPGSKLRGEGLMRLLDFISAGFPEANARFLIVTPPWMRDEFEDELKDMSPERRAIYSVSTPTSLFGAIYGPIYRFQTRRSSLDYELRKLKKKKPSAIKPVLVRLRRYFLSTPAFTLGLVLLMLALLIMAIVMFPGISLLVLLAVTLAVALVGVLAVIRSSERLNVAFERLTNFLKSIASQPWRVVKGIASKVSARVVAVKDLMLDADLRLQAVVASRQTNVDCWFTLHVTADSARFLKGPKVALFADFVFLDCPSLGSRAWLRRAKIKTRRLVKSIDAVITLAEHVRDNQLYRYFPAARSAHVVVINHAPIDLSVDLPGGFGHLAPAKTEETLKASGDAIRQHVRLSLSKERLRRHFKLAGYSDIYEHQFRYIDGFPFEDTRYIFVSTQIRPYKNILNLIKAVEFLIRRRGVRVKIVLSGNFQPGQDVFEYVRDNGLNFDVWSIPHLPRDAHAAMYHCATLTIHPTFFEGGQGAFPLSESLSVGTPVLLSRHPGTLADADSPVYLEMLFDPYSIEEIADRIEAALQDADALIKRQYPLFLERKEWRSWSDVSKEYIEVFQYAKRLGENGRKVKKGLLVQ
jgi:glycosyltransferase involved in cell wall biosynthesis